MKNVRIFPWNKNSKGAQELSGATGILRLKEGASRFIHGPNKTIVNWGSSRYPTEESVISKWINKPESIKIVSNKLLFFQKFDTDGICVPWSESKDKAVEWLSDGKVVFARTTLNGHSGQGIKIMEPNDPESWVRAPLYTLYVPKKMEFRVHIANGKVFLVQKKVLRKGVDKDQQNFKIRNTANGFVFQRNDVIVPERVTEVALKFEATQNKTLDFYALDVLYNEARDEAFVLEANSSPGLSGTTINDYKGMVLSLVS